MRKPEATPTLDVIDAGAIPEPDPMAARNRQKARLLAAVTGSTPCSAWQLTRQERQLGECPAWIARQAVGGHVPPEAFRSLVEELIAEGAILEVWCQRDGLPVTPHRLVAPGFRRLLRRRPVRVRGRRDLVLAEYPDVAPTLVGE
jgi:hypothetical protein